MSNVSVCFQCFKQDVGHIPLPEKLNNPFHHTTDELARLAVEEVQLFLSNYDLGHDFGLKNKNGLGKMFGVLVGLDQTGQMGYLAAFSGKLDSGTKIEFFVPPVFDTFETGGFYKMEEENINILNREIETTLQASEYILTLHELENNRNQYGTEISNLKKKYKQDKEKRAEIRKTYQKNLTLEDKDILQKLNHESARQHFEFKDLNRNWKQTLDVLEKNLNVFQMKVETLKDERRNLSKKLQNSLFEKYTFLNFLGEEKSLQDIFIVNESTIPPSGAGECAAPKLLQYAYQHNIRPLAIAEFWWGVSPASEIRKHGFFYPACRSKCLPILTHMLQGLEVEELPEPVLAHLGDEIPIIYEDDYLVVVNKPAPFLSVPGKTIRDSVLERLKKRYPEATGPLLVHRLDMSTSGVMIAAKNKDVHAHLQKQFEDRKIKKKYVALLEGVLYEFEGKIDLPMRVDLEDRPRQLVCFEHGKRAITLWKVLKVQDGETRIQFTPITGRTHQLRVHAAHTSGLNIPIKGDDLYGKVSDRLYLHAEEITFTHPITEKIMTLRSEVPF